MTPFRALYLSPELLKISSGATCALQVLLTYVPASGAQRLPAGITSQDSKGMRPLDVALVTQQWQAVRLLIGAGALQACPELTQAQRQLRQALLLPDSRRPSGALPLLVRALCSIRCTLDLHRLSPATSHSFPDPFPHWHFSMTRNHNTEKMKSAYQFRDLCRSIMSSVWLSFLPSHIGLGRQNSVIMDCRGEP